MNDFNRRNFLKLSGFSVLPILTGGINAASRVKSDGNRSNIETFPDVKETVWFINDGPMYKPTRYIEKLQEIDAEKKIMRDFYGHGGCIDELTKKFSLITGKESAIFMPSGTMANQLAIHTLSGTNTKVFVQETSHVYRDEADAAQSLFNKRLIPLGKGEPFFTLSELKNAIDYYEKGEVFKSGSGGVVSIENPVRRNDGAFVPIEELRSISEYCKSSGYKLHLDGARIFMASAATGIPVSEYASLFDTVYISLYKYLGAAAGAVLCGNKELVDKMDHQVKIHGGSMFSNWTNAAVALHHLEGLEERLNKVRLKATDLIKSFNALNISITPAVKNNTNMFYLKFLQQVDIKKVIANLKDKHNIVLQSPNQEGIIRITINDSLLLQENEKIIGSFKEAIKSS